MTVSVESCHHWIEFLFVLSIVMSDFCFFKQKTAYEMRISDWSSDVCSSDLIRDGKVLLTSRTARTFPKDHVEPRIIEIMFGTHSGSPIFAYYLCPAYHAAAVGPAGAAAFGGHHRTEQFRMAVSESIARFRSEEHTSELQSLMRISYAVFC